LLTDTPQASYRRVSVKNNSVSINKNGQTLAWHNYAIAQNRRCISASEKQINNNYNDPIGLNIYRRGS